MTASGRIRVAFQGEPGAFSEEAALRLFGPRVETVPRRDFRAVGRAVAGGDVEAGLLPVENTIAGSVAGSYDVLAGEGLTVVGEVVTPIHHCVLGTPGATLDGLTSVLSHPVALAQCTRFLETLAGVEAVPVYDTAGAAKQVAEQADRATAAIAGRMAAERYGLDILAADVEDRSDNQTRFLAIARSGAPAPAPLARPGAGVAVKSMLLVEMRDEPGALVRVLTPFAAHGLNLSKLELRPAPEPWTYRFFLELETDASMPAARQAIAEATQHATSLRVLGSFPAAASSPTHLQQESTP